MRSQHPSVPVAPGTLNTRLRASPHLSDSSTTHTTQKDRQCWSRPRPSARRSAGPAAVGERGQPLANRRATSPRGGVQGRPVDNGGRGGEGGWEGGSGGRWGGVEGSFLPACGGSRSGWDSRRARCESARRAGEEREKEVPADGLPASGQAAGGGDHDAPAAMRTTRRRWRTRPAAFQPPCPCTQERGTGEAS